MSALITAEGLVRLDAALAWIDEHPEQHNQDMWIERTDCGTTYCLAGVVVMQAGAVPRWHYAAEYSTSDILLPDGRPSSVSTHARKLLEIDYAEGSELFLYAETRAALGVIRDRLADSLVGAL